MRKTSLSGGETEVILMAMGTVQLGKATTLDRDKAVVEESMGVIAIPRNLARRKQAVQKDSTHARSQWVTNP